MMIEQLALILFTFIGTTTGKPHHCSAVFPGTNGICKINSKKTGSVMLGEEQTPSKALNKLSVNRNAEDYQLFPYCIFTIASQ